jgi:hypothetical protein
MTFIKHERWISRGGGLTQIHSILWKPEGTAGRISLFIAFLTLECKWSVKFCIWDRSENLTEEFSSGIEWNVVRSGASSAWCCEWCCSSFSKSRSRNCVLSKPYTAAVEGTAGCGCKSPFGDFREDIICLECFGKSGGGSEFWPGSTLWLGSSLALSTNSTGITRPIKVFI